MEHEFEAYFLDLTPVPVDFCTSVLVVTRSNGHALATNEKETKHASNGLNGELILGQGPATFELT